MRLVAVTTLGENIKALRESRRINQKTLAERIGTTPPTVNNWESGRRVDVPLETVLSIAKALEVSVEAILDGVDPAYSATIKTADGDRGRLRWLCASLSDAQSRALIPAAETFLYGAPRADDEAPEG